MKIFSLFLVWSKIVWTNIKVYSLKFYLCFYWSIIALQCCISFSCSTKWMRCKCTCIFSLLDISPTTSPIPLLEAITEHGAEFPVLDDRLPKACLSLVLRNSLLFISFHPFFLFLEFCKMNVELHVLLLHVIKRMIFYFYNFSFMYYFRYMILSWDAFLHLLILFGYPMEWIFQKKVGQMFEFSLSLPQFLVQWIDSLLCF